LTLNDDHGTQYVETHQLSIPPVQCLSTSELAFLGRIAARARMLAPEEHSKGERIVEHIVRKAQMLLKCAHDALEAKGLEGIGTLFAAPVVIEEDEHGDLTVHGSVTEGSPSNDINSIDVRARFMQLDDDWEERVGGEDHSWQYPGPDDDDDDDDVEEVALSRLTSESASVQEGPSGDSASSASAAATAAAVAVAPEAKTASVAVDPATRPVEVNAPESLSPAAAADPPRGMKRIESWMEDKFTAQPTRTTFPPLSDLNHLNHEDETIASSPQSDTKDASYSENVLVLEAVALDTPAGTEQTSGQCSPVVTPGTSAPAEQPSDRLAPVVTRGTPAGTDQPSGPTPPVPEGDVSSSTSNSSSTPARYRRHVFSIRSPADTALDKSDAEQAAANGIETHVYIETHVHIETHVEAAKWAQPCVGHLEAAEALVADTADSMGSDSGDGWRETVASPRAGQLVTIHGPASKEETVDAHKEILGGYSEGTSGAALDGASSCGASEVTQSTGGHGADGAASALRSSLPAHPDSAIDCCLTARTAVPATQPDALSGESDGTAAEEEADESAQGREKDSEEVGDEQKGTTGGDADEGGISGEKGSGKAGDGPKGTAAGDADDSATGGEKGPEEAGEGPKECLISPPSRGILVKRDGGTRSATKQTFIEAAPPLLLIHLNRFQHAATGARKRQVHVAFPFHLFVHPAIAQRPESVDAAVDAVRYRLKAVLVHKGLRHDSGHYVCYVWRPPVLVRAAAKALQWMPPGPSKPILIPQHGARRRRERRSHDGGHGSRRGMSYLPGVLHASASYSNTELGHAAGRLQSGNLSLPGTCMEGVWRAMHSSSPHRRNGDTWSSKLPELPGAGASADLVDWEELADQPVPINAARALSRSAMLRCSSTESSDSLQPTRGSQVQASSSEGAKGFREEEEEEEAPPRIGELLACESLEDVGVWAMCDDERVRAVSWKTVARESAYMLMYEQV
jgi:hypothetical protein